MSPAAFLTGAQEAFWSACHARDEKRIERALKRGMDARFCDASGITPLMIAIDSGVGDKALGLIGEASDLLALDAAGDGVARRAARHARGPLLGWLAEAPGLAGQGACWDAAFARWGDGVGAMLRAIESKEGGAVARISALGCLAFAVRSGVAVGDEVELAWLRGAPPGADAALARVIKTMWAGPRGAKRQCDLVAKEEAELSSVLTVLWDWMDADRWERELAEARDRAAHGSVHRQRRVENAAGLARAFAARAEAASLREAALPAAPDASGDRGRL